MKKCDIKGGQNTLTHPTDFHGSRLPTPRSTPLNHIQEILKPLFV